MSVPEPRTSRSRSRSRTPSTPATQDRSEMEESTTPDDKSSVESADLEYVDGDPPQPMWVFPATGVFVLGDAMFNMDHVVRVTKAPPPDHAPTEHAIIHTVDGDFPVDLPPGMPFPTFCRLLSSTRAPREFVPRLGNSKPRARTSHAAEDFVRPPAAFMEACMQAVDEADRLGV